MLYHLFNLAWHFRRRFIEHYKEEDGGLLPICRNPISGGTHGRIRVEELNDVVRSLSVDLKAWRPTRRYAD